MASVLVQNVRVAARLSARFLNCSAGPRSFFSSWLLGRTQLSHRSQAVTATQPHGTDLLPFLTSGPLSSLQHVAGMKCKVVLRKRCKDCFIVRRRGRLYVYCKTHPRHKQRQF